MSPGREPVLLDGLDDRSLRLELLRWLITPEVDRIDLVVSFVMKSGLALIADHLEAAARRGAQIRILTTDYLDITDPDALTQLVDLADSPDFGGDGEGGGPRFQVKVFHDPKVSFHPKAYLFHSSTSPVAGGFVGSSNLSHSGIDGGVEWNLEVDQVAPLVESFERLWDDPRSVEVDSRWLTAYRLRRRPDDAPRVVPEAAVPIEPPKQPAEPWPVQAEALAALEQTRIAGFRRGLVVMATGLGKTWLAAFDSARPGFSRVLFVAHREEILRQSRDIFRQVRPDGDFGFFGGVDKEPDADVVFAGIQTLGRHLNRFTAEQFDYVVVDEFHHAAAPTYRRVIEHFHPKFLLGLTATPDRRDGADLLALCGDNLVFECDLGEGIRRGNLTPFRYWGVKDGTDYAPIPWRSGQFDPDQLAAAIETVERAEQIFGEWRDKGRGPTLAFCSSINHAEFMAQFFNERGVQAVAVHSGPRSAPRQSAVEQLQAGAIEVLFTVDVFNEGVDIPEVSTVLMLRPTSSPVVFLQQLGRGLRAAEDKPALRAIDFVGNHHSFLMKPRTLLSLGFRTPTNIEVIEALQTGEFELPPGCSVEFELEAVEVLSGILERRGRRQNKDLILSQFCRNYFDEHGVRPTAAQAFRSVGIKPSFGAGKKVGGWHRYLETLEMLTLDQQVAVGAAGDLLGGVEKESITKSYKLVALQALFELGAAGGPVPVADVAARSLDIIKGDHRLRADVHTNEVPDVATVSAEKWRSYWWKWPLVHLSNKETSLFRHEPGVEGGTMVPNFSVSAQHLDSVVDLVFEILDWRQQVYLSDKGLMLAPMDITSRLSIPQGDATDAWDEAEGDIAN